MMDAERARALVLSFAHVVETAQWGGVVFWAGDKAIGGKMFAMLNPDPGTGPPLSWAAGPERFHELLEIEGLSPAPYFARVHWVSAERWSVLPDRVWETELRAGHDLTLAKLASRTRAVLALPAVEQRRAVADSRQRLAAKAAVKRAKA